MANQKALLCKKLDELLGQRISREEHLMSLLCQREKEETRLALKGEAIPAGDPSFVKQGRRDIFLLNKEIRSLRRAIASCRE